VGQGNDGCALPDLGLTSLARRGQWPRSGSLILAGIGIGLVTSATLGWFSLGPVAGLTGLSLTFAALVVRFLTLLDPSNPQRDERRVFELLADDPAAWLSTDPQGHLILRNPAAEARFGSDARTMLEGLTRSVLDPGPLLMRLQTQAAADGFARHDTAVHNGMLRLSVQRSVQRQGAERYLWRIEDFRLPSSLPDDPMPERTLPERPASDTGGADLEEVPVAMMTFGRDGVLRSANRFARDLMLQGELRSLMFHDLFDGLGRPVSDWLADVVAGRLPGGTEVLRSRTIPDETFVQITLQRFNDAGRTLVLAVLNDATQLKTLEAQFAQSQKMQAIGQLAGGIAHDFNNLLTAISGHCDLLLMRHAQEDQDFGDLEQIRQNANRAASLVGQLLAFSRKQTLKPERLDLEEVLSDLTHLLNRLVVEKVGLSLAHLGQGARRPLSPIRADRRQLEQVLINLVVNSRDALPDGGNIVIETEPVTLLADLRRDRALVPAGDYSVIRVRDEGTGIAPENLERIFEPFFTTKGVGEGTGLGLSMAYGIIKQSGGFIFADSTVGKGTVFTLFFPTFDGEVPVEAPPPARRKSVRQGAGVVLLVEDEAPVRAFAGRALRLCGYTVLEAANGEEALKVLEDSSLEVDVFVTDVMMPGMDGPTWVREALLDRPQVRVVFVSGYAEDVLNNGQAGIPNSVFLPKPFSLTDLTTTVQGQVL